MISFTRAIWFLPDFPQGRGRSPAVAPRILVEQVEEAVNEFAHLLRMGAGYQPQALQGPPIQEGARFVEKLHQDGGHP